MNRRRFLALVGTGALAGCPAFPESEDTPASDPTPTATRSPTATEESDATPGGPTTVPTTATASPATATEIPTPSPTPTESPTPTASATPTETPSPTPSPTPTASPTPTPTPSPTPTPTPSPTPTPEPASFVVEDFSVPDSAQIGELFEMTVRVKNTGEQDGVFRSPLSAKTSDSGWVRSEDPVAIEVEAGETEIETLSDSLEYEYLTTVTYRLDATADIAEIDIVGRRLIFGESYTNPDEVTLTAEYDTFTDEYTYRQNGDQKVHESSEGFKWLLVDFAAENEADEPADAPRISDVVVIVDETQYGYVPYRRENHQYEGGEILEDVVRDGTILYEVPDDVQAVDVEVVYSDSFVDGDVAVYWST